MIKHIQKWFDNKFDGREMWVLISTLGIIVALTLALVVVDKMNIYIKLLCLIVLGLAHIINLMLWEYGLNRTDNWYAKARQELRLKNKFPKQAAYALMVQSILLTAASLRLVVFNIASLFAIAFLMFAAIGVYQTVKLLFMIRLSQKLTKNRTM